MNGTSEYFTLAESGLQIRDGHLLRVDSKGNTISSTPLASITNAHCRRVYHFVTFIFACLCLWVSYLLYAHLDIWFFKWFVSGCVFLVGLFAFIGGVTEHEMEVTTKDGKLKFGILGDVRDAEAFAMTLLQLRPK